MNEQHSNLSRPVFTGDEPPIEPTKTGLLDETHDQAPPSAASSVG